MKCGPPVDGSLRVFRFRYYCNRCCCDVILHTCSHVISDMDFLALVLLVVVVVERQFPFFEWEMKIIFQLLKRTLFMNLEIPA